MAAFKVGDTVRYRSSRYSHPGNAGGVGTVRKVLTSDGAWLEVETHASDGLPFRDRELTIVPVTDNYEPEKGDRVRVTIEGEVTDTGTHEGHHFDIEGGLVFTHAEGVTVELVEKAKPPVVTFGPGDFVRHRASGRLFYLGTERHTRLFVDFEGRDGHSVEYGVGGYNRHFFTSENFEKVELHEAPL